MDSSTCIAAVRGKDTTVIAADTAASGNGESVSTRQPKIVAKSGGRLLAGLTGRVRDLNLLRYGLNLSDIDPSNNLHHATVKQIVPRMREFFEDRGRLEENETESRFLLASEGGIVTIEQDFSVVEAQKNSRAVGCGRKQAHGAMHVAGQHGAVKRAEKALSAAAEYATKVQRPFHYMTLEDPEPRGFDNLSVGDLRL